jgi:predicted RNA-binding protein YlqC (UPF0109 family)
MPANPTPSAVVADNYNKLVRFLLQPLLDHPDSLRVDAEVNASATKVWLRVAIAQADRARILGKGGKTMQTIRTILQAAAKNLGQSLTLELYEAGRN